MAFTIPTIEPIQIAVGDRLQWTKHLPDFSPADWTLTYYLRGVKGVPGFEPINIAATTSGNLFSVDVAPSVTEFWIPQLLFWQSYVSKSGDRKLVGSGRMDLLPNFAATDEPYDGRSWARRCRDNLQLVLEGKASRDTIRYAMSAAGRSEEKFTWEDIIAALSYFQGLVAQEEAAEEAARGGSSKKNILIRFNCP